MKEHLKHVVLTALLVSCFVGWTGEVSLAEDETIFLRVEPQKYRVRTEIGLHSTKKSAVVYIPFPQSNALQTVENIDHSEGEICELPSAPGEVYLKVSFPDGIPSRIIVFNEFYVTLWCGKVDFTKITEIYPYDTSTALYQEYTRADLPMIDPEHPEIKRIVAELAPEAANDLEFARLAFRYVLDNIKQEYVSYTYNLPLEKALTTRKSVSYGLGNMIISLLRSKGIPARNVVALNVSGNRVSWLEFYLQNHGWIPLKITSLGNFIDQESYFGMSIAPPNWSDRQPHSLVTGFTLVNGQLPGVDDSNPITFSGPPLLKIHYRGASGGSAKVLLEKVHD